MPFGRWGGEAVGASGGDSNQQSVELDRGRGHNSNSTGGVGVNLN